MTRDIDIIANLEALDNGKPFITAKMETYYSMTLIRSYATYIGKVYGRTMTSEGATFSYTRKEPIGVVGSIFAWNFPILIFVVKMAPAIAAGCTVVLKPAEQTPLTALYMAALTKEAGFPNGVINVIPGFGPTAGAAISSHMKIRKVAFTGSSEVGKLIMTAAAQSNLKKISLELGGKSPLVIFDDVDCESLINEFL
jgi:aldehyde dehydrogenase (NAD+)